MLLAVRLHKIRTFPHRPGGITIEKAIVENTPNDDSHKKYDNVQKNMKRLLIFLICNECIKMIAGERILRSLDYDVFSIFKLIHRQVL